MQLLNTLPARESLAELSPNLKTVFTALELRMWLFASLLGLLNVPQFVGKILRCFADVSLEVASLTLTVLLSRYCDAVLC